MARRARGGRPARAGLVAVVVLALAWTLYGTAGELHNSLSDQKAQSYAWVQANVPPGATVVVDPYSPFVDPARWHVVVLRATSVGGVAYPAWYVLQNPPALRAAHPDVVITTSAGSGRYLGARFIDRPRHAGVPGRRVVRPSQLRSRDRRCLGPALHRDRRARGHDARSGADGAGVRWIRSARRPSMRTGISVPSRVMPVTATSGDPIMKSMWMPERFMCCAVGFVDGVRVRGADGDVAGGVLVQERVVEDGAQRADAPAAVHQRDLAQA